MTHNYLKKRRKNVKIQDALDRCQQCGAITKHKVDESGLDEIRTCRVCGTQKWYRVR